MRTLLYSTRTGQIRQTLPERVQPSPNLYSRGYRALHIEDIPDAVAQLWAPQHTHVVMKDGEVVGFIRRSGLAPMRAPMSEHYEAKNKLRVTSLGDVLMSLPAAEAYSQKLGKDLVYITDPQMIPFLERLDWVERAVSVRRSRYPAHRVIELEKEAESVSPENRKPRPEIFADLLNVQLSLSEMPNYAVIAPDELEWAQKIVKDLPRPLIAISPKARTRHRMWGQEQDLFDSMPDATFLLISKERVKITAKNVVSVSGKTTVNALFALLSLCDAAGVNDTGLMHVAGMLGLPYVAVFGAVHPPHEFTSLYPSVYPMEISYGRAVEDTKIDFPIFSCGPCYNGKVHDCLGTDHEKWCHRAITPSMVADAFDVVMSGAPVVIEKPPVPVPTRTRIVSKVAVIDVGGLGDHLVRANVARQALSRLLDAWPNAKVTYITRQPYALTKGLPFIDDWKFVPEGVVHHDASHEAVHEFDTVFDLRYSGQVLSNGQPWVGNNHLGYDGGKFIGESIASTLGDYAYEDDGEYLSKHLRATSVGLLEKGTVELATRQADKIVVVTNGTDPTFGLLTKRIPTHVLHGICERLVEAGYTPVEVGTKGTEATGVIGSVNLIGKTNLAQILYLMTKDNCAGVLGADTGLAHLASHLKLRTVVLFGPTDSVFWGYPGNLNLTSENDCHLQACWLTMPQWHVACRKDAEERRETPTNTPPICMTGFSALEVAESALSWYS